MLKWFKKAQPSSEPVLTNITPTATVTEMEDIRAAYLSAGELNAANIGKLCDVADGVSLVLGFASPDNNFAQ
ncbi:MAG TPA: hypothetical protein DEA44_05110, partial [Firmicutes bacterium]|nr:hypothetical protein [Bacillota bacterium]